MGARLVVTVMPRSRDLTAAVLVDPPPGADYVELRLDALPAPTPRAVAEMLALPRSIPVIATCRAGAAQADEQCLALLAAAGEAGADVLDVEDTLLPRLPASVPGERLASGHVSRFVPRLAALARRVAGHGTPLAKLGCRPTRRASCATCSRCRRSSPRTSPSCPPGGWRRRAA
jgi:3-dehydroquinate dehydratase